MLDENLPTFRFKPSPDNNPLANIIYLAQHGEDPTPEYLLRRADASQPAGRNKYAVALCSSFSSDIIYAEVVVEPEWTQPTLSAAEIRAQNGAPAAPVATVPDSFSVLLYNPDQTVTFKLAAGGWPKSDSWEFEMPTQTFKMPSASEIDRQQESASLGGGPADVVPRITFRWKKDGRLTKDMTCYMTGKSLGGKKSKEPDITIALFKAGKDTSVTVYEPNLQRVEIEDMKGFEVVLLLAAEVIRDLYLIPRHDVFNTMGSAPGAATHAGGRSDPHIRTSSSPMAMSGALGNLAPSSPTTGTPAARPPPGAAAAAGAPAGAGAVDAETRRVQAMVEREREKRDRAEQKRIKKMLEEEEKMQRRRDAEVAKETERLRKMYGTQGQDLPSSSARGRANNPVSPPLPPRPLSVGPTPNLGGPNGYTNYGPPPQYLQSPPPPGQSGGLNLQNPAASASTFFGMNRTDDGRRKVQKKRSSHW